jgi:poly [ADP-ribose] polymerase
MVSSIPAGELTADVKPLPPSPSKDNWSAEDLEPSAQKATSKDICVMLDEGAPANYNVYIDSDLTIWDASLNQTNASNNNNKFYRLQVRIILAYS